jgi:hypothetical protein
MNATSFNKVFAGGYIATYALASVPAYSPAYFSDMAVNRELSVHVHVHMQVHLLIVEQCIIIIMMI